MGTAFSRARPLCNRFSEDRAVKPYFVGALALTACVLLLSLAPAEEAKAPAAFDVAAAAADTCRGHEKNRARYLEALDTIVNRRELARVEEFYAAEYRNNSGPPGAPQGPAAIRHYLTLLGTAFPDRKVENVMLLCAGDFVIVRSVVTGTHRGDYFGRPATGHATRVMGTDIYRMRDGMLMERWGNEDALGLERQLSSNN